MPLMQFARGLWAKFGHGENPFSVPNGMEENLRCLDDHLGLYTLEPPQAPGTALPDNPANGDGQIYTDGTYSTFNGGTWKSYEPRVGVRVVLASGTEHWLNTGEGWAQYSVVDTGPAVAAVSGLVAAAEAARDAANAARDAANATGKVFATTAAGLAATINGQYFSVPSANSTEYLILYLNSAGSAVEQKRYPSAAAIDALYTERMIASQTSALERKRNVTVQLPKAAVVILLGQSNNTPRGAPISGVVSPNVFMPAAGNSMTYFPYNATNADWVCHWNDVATAVVHQEGAAESPCSGMALGLLGGVYERVYICSVAKGSSSLKYLHADGVMTNLWAVVNKLCDAARTAGYEPEVLFDTHQGESDSFLYGSEAEYFADGFDYYRQAKMIAALAMDKPDYEAPIVFHMPLAYGTFGSADNMRNVASGIRRLAKELPNSILAGGSFQFPTEGDRVHQTNVGMRLRGEYGGYLLNQFCQHGRREQSPSIVDAKLAGAVVTLVFSREVINDAALTYGSALNAANALYGVEFLDDAAYIKINSITFQGRVATVTLNAVPAGTVQTLQIASQTMAGGAYGDSVISGTSIRVPGTGIPSIYMPSRVYYDLCTPQRITVR